MVGDAPPGKKKRGYSGMMSERASSQVNDFSKKKRRFTRVFKGSPLGTRKNMWEGVSKPRRGNPDLSNGDMLGRV